MAERVLSRHVYRRKARKREKQLEGWQRTVRNWLRDETGDWRTTSVPVLPGLIEPGTGEIVTGADPVPPAVRAAEERLIAAGTFHTDTIRAEGRRRGLRFAVVAEN